MRRLVLLTALVVLALPAPAGADACSPLDCAPSQFALGHLLATRASTTAPLRVLDLRTGRTIGTAPPGVVAGRVLVHLTDDVLTWIDLGSGRTIRQVLVHEPLAPAFSLVGVSQDASRAVLARTDATGTTFLVAGRGASQRLRFPGRRPWEFDALSGDRLYLIRELVRGYQVRLYDLAADRLVAQPLKDPDGSSTIWGTAFARLASPHGRYLFTLYLAPDGGAMVHELDVRDAVARCVELPGDGDFSRAMTYSLALSPDGRTLWAVSPGYGRAAAIDVARHRVRTVLRFDGWWEGNAGVAATARDGRIAVTEGEHVWIVEPARHRVVHAATRSVRALGFDPDGSRLWIVGPHGRVSSLGPFTTRAGTRGR